VSSVWTHASIPRHASRVERLFSVAGHVVTAKRASLDPHTVKLSAFLLHKALLVVREMKVRKKMKDTIVV